MTDKEKANKYLETIKTMIYGFDDNAIDISCELGNAYIDGLKAGREELKAVIEEMKCCDNCAYSEEDVYICDECNSEYSKWKL